MFPVPSFSQQTYVPDDNFEAYLEASGYGNGIPNDNYITTSNISSLVFLNVNYQSISDLTGIEDFVSLEQLDCAYNQLSALNTSQNSALTELYCESNSIASLDVSQNIGLIILDCSQNNISALNVSQNTNLEYLNFTSNNIASIDVSLNSQLTNFHGDANQLTEIDLTQNSNLTNISCVANDGLVCLNIKNGNSQNIPNYGFVASLNPQLYCIEVDDVAYANANWTFAAGSIDAHMSFSTYCNNNCSVGIEELEGNSRELIKIINLLGQESYDNPNTTLINIYSDGTTEKVYRIE